MRELNDFLFWHFHTMERPKGLTKMSLFLVFSLFAGIVTGSAPAHGRIQECPPESQIDSQCGPEICPHLCDGCRIRKTKCEEDGDPNGTITYHFPSGEKYAEVLGAWKDKPASFAKAHSCQKYIENVDNCPVCTDDQ